MIKSIKNIPFWTYAGEIRLIGWVGLNAQAGCENKLSDGSAEAGEKSIEWLLGRFRQSEISFLGEGRGIEI